MIRQTTLAARTPRAEARATAPLEAVAPRRAPAPRRDPVDRESGGAGELGPFDESTIPFPLILQRRAKDAVRRHMVRGVTRTAVLLASDLAALALCRALLVGLRDAGWAGPQVAWLVAALVPPGTFPAVQFVAAVLLGVLLLGTYRPSDRRRDPAALTAGATLGLGLVYWNTLWTSFTWLRPIGFALVVGVVVGQLVAQRAVLDLLVRWVRPRNDLAARVLLVASPAEAKEATASMALSNAGEFHVVGFLDTQPHASGEALGGALDLVRVVERHRIDTVVFCGRVEDATMSRLLHLADAAGCHALCIPRAFTLSGFQPQLVWHSGEPLVQLTRPGVRGSQLLLKTAVDLVVALAGLIVLSPVMLALALAVRLTSPGPAIFAQERVGQGGRRFRVYKFRSMVSDAESRRAELTAQSVYPDARLFKLRADPRITRLGAFLRRSSLDELPQLWNVLRGEMSLVGPRPPLPCEVALYEDHHYHRLDMKPGITGPWQVGGRNSITDFEEVVRLEQSYVRHWSIWKDVAILARTLPAVVRMDGAL